MHVTIVGPTHPYKGGIAQHTTSLAHRLAATGAHVDLVSWSAQYPSALYPGVQRVSTPEVPIFHGTRFPLAWYRPDSWWRLGRSLRHISKGLLLLVLVTPLQVPAYLTMIAAMGRRRPPHRRPRVGVICHNVLPHEPRSGDRFLTRALLTRSDVVLTHADQQAALARQLGARDVRTEELPPFGPGSSPAPPVATAQNSGKAAQGNRGGGGLLFFGFIRPYKGVEVLLRALAQVPDVRLVIAGEVWDGEDRLRALVNDLCLADRVDLRLAYLPNDEVDVLLRDADALVLPYTSGTGTQQVRVAQAHGVPVIASRVSTMPDQVLDDVDGFLVRPGDVEELAAAIRRLYEPGRLEQLRSAVQPPDDDAIWRQYVEALTAPHGSKARPNHASVVEEIPTRISTDRPGNSTPAARRPRQRNADE
jgi:D-inositol-3-phosphate glycosyltransferase